MRWTPLISAFLLNKKALIITKRQLGPQDIIETEIKPKRYGIQGFDERYLIYNNITDNTTNITETLLKIKKYMNQSALLNILESPHVSIHDKIKHMDEHEKTFGHGSMTNNISAGGLWTDFNYNIEI